VWDEVELLSEEQAESAMDLFSSWSSGTLALVQAAREI
jgi:hypothetical protein